MTLKVRVVQDFEPLNPREDDINQGIMACCHKRYTLGDKTDIPFNDFNSWSEVEEYLRRKRQAVCILPIYMYDHSGLTVSTKPFSCLWDSGQIGFIYTTKDRIRQAYGVKRVGGTLLTIVQGELQAEVRRYDQHLRGDAYGYEIYDDESNEILESCWNYYDKEDCQKEGESALKQILSQG